MPQGVNNGRWKGESASYAAVHMWMRKQFGKPQMCENCGTTEKRMYHWANISGTYARDRSDWLRLCVPCHKSHDIKVLGGKIKAKPKKIQPSKVCAECHCQFFKSPQLSSKQWNDKYLCSRACATKVTARKNLGSKQSTETKALKSEKLRDRWATNQQWCDRQVTRMIGNKYAVGITK